MIKDNQRTFNQIHILVDALLIAGTYLLSYVLRFDLLTSFDFFVLEQLTGYYDIRHYASYPAFAGITFCDECGYLSFPGVAHAKRVFDQNFPGREFHANFLSYSLNDEIFWGGTEFQGRPGALAAMELPFSLTGELKIAFENRFNFYDRLVEGLLSKAHFEILSQDRYPYEDVWPTVPTAVHKALFELNAYFKLKSMKYGSCFFNFMQIGHWFKAGRKMPFGEMALQVNVTIAYGAAGFGWFPGLYPLDWRNDDNMEGKDGGAAFIDLNGNPTQYVSWVKTLNDFMKKREEDPSIFPVTL